MALLVRVFLFQGLAYFKSTCLLQGTQDIVPIKTSSDTQTWDHIQMKLQFSLTK